MSSPSTLPTIAPRLFPGQKTQIFASPFQWYFTGAENLQIACANSLPGVTLRVQARVFLDNGMPSWQSFDFIPTSNRAVTHANFHIGACVLTNLVIFAVGASPKIGQTFAQVKVVLGDNATPITLGTLLQGYVTSAQELAWPGSPISDSTSSGGYLRLVTGTMPAAGAEIAESVPTGARWELVALLVGFVGNSAGAPRETSLVLAQSGGEFVISPIPDPMPIAGLVKVGWAQGFAFDTALVPATINAALPGGVQLLAGATIGTTTAALAAADQWNTPRLLVREWLEAQ